MDIFSVFWNLFENIMAIILYVMPFWLFDSVSYFIDIYDNALFLLLLLIISVFLGFMFLVYLIELLNIPIKVDQIQWVNMSDEDKANTPTFFSELIKFIFWRSNFWTFFPVLIEFFANLRFKIVPILIIASILYIPLTPTSRWYNTVWEFYFTNRDVILYNVPIVWTKWKLTEQDIEERLKYASLNESEKSENKFIYTDTSFLLKEMNENTISNTRLNFLLNKEVNMYEKVYNDESYNEYKSDLDEKISEINTLIKSEETKKDNAENPNDIANHINNINDLKRNLEDLEQEKSEIDEIYEKLTYKIDEDNLNMLKDKYKSDLSYVNIQKNIIDDITKIEEWKKTITEVNSTFNNIIDKLNNYIENKTISGFNKDWLSEYEEKFIDDIIIYSTNNNSLNNEDDVISNFEFIKRMIKKDNGSELLVRDYNNLLDKEKELIKKDIELSWKINNIESISESPEARLKYIIDLNSDRLSNYEIGGEFENQRQILLLLQYKLLSNKENLNPESSSVKILGNRVEYIWVDVFKWLWLVVVIITSIFTFFYYISIVLMAGWKNILILYISFINAVLKAFERFLSWTNVENKAKEHVSTIINQIFPWWNDPEYKWFIENSNNRETYIIMILEFLIRFVILYILFNNIQ